MPVDSTSAEYKKHEISVRTMRDVIDGEDAIKARDYNADVKTYLPGFVPANPTRYKAFITRANFVGFTARTSTGMKGAIERKPAVIELPSTLEYMRDDCDGSGTNLSAFAGKICKELLDVGECGVLLDRPPKAEGNSLEDDILMGLKTTLALYQREAVINHKSRVVGSQSLPYLIVLVESIEKDVDEFTSDAQPQYRVLATDESGNYYQRIYDENKALIDGPFFITKADGAVWDKITFMTVGAECNVYGANEPPLYPLAKVNLAHYRNSATYEDGVHMHGQPTLVIDPGDMNSESFVAANPGGVVVGSQKGLVLGNGGKADLIQMEANTAAHEAMVQKEQQLLMIGAKISQASTIERTAEEARINAGAETSLLNTIVQNVNDAIVTMLKDACEIEGGNPEDVKFALNTEFYPETLDPQMIPALITAADRGDIAQSDIRDIYRKSGLLAPERTNEEIDNELDETGFKIINEAGGE